MSTVSKDHEGRTFKSMEAMCRYWHIIPTTLETRLENGWSIKKALTTPPAKVQQCCTDHMGNEFKSYKDMCDHWGVYVGTFRSRCKRGLSIKEALTARS